MVTIQTDGAIREASSDAALQGEAADRARQEGAALENQAPTLLTGPQPQERLQPGRELYERYEEGSMRESGTKHYQTTETSAIKDSRNRRYKRTEPAL